MNDTDFKVINTGVAAREKRCPQCSLYRKGGGRGGVNCIIRMSDLRRNGYTGTVAGCGEGDVIKVNSARAIALIAQLKLGSFPEWMHKENHDG